MKKLFVIYEDDSKTTYTMKDCVDEMKYVNRHINSFNVKSIIFQKYPKKKFEPVIFK